MENKNYREWYLENGSDRLYDAYSDLLDIEPEEFYADLNVKRSKGLLDFVNSFDASQNLLEISVMEAVEEDRYNR